MSRTSQGTVKEQSRNSQARLGEGNGCLLHRIEELDDFQTEGVLVCFDVSTGAAAGVSCGRQQ